MLFNMIIHDKCGYSGLSVIISSGDRLFLRSFIDHLRLRTLEGRKLSVSALCELIVRDEVCKLRLDFPNLCNEVKDET